MDEGLYPAAPDAELVPSPGRRPCFISALHIAQDNATLAYMRAEGGWVSINDILAGMDSRHSPVLAALQRLHAQGLVDHRDRPRLCWRASAWWRRRPRGGQDGAPGAKAEDPGA